MLQSIVVIFSRGRLAASKSLNMEEVTLGDLILDQVELLLAEIVRHFDFVSWQFSSQSRLVVFFSLLQVPYDFLIVG
jgi:hypothetical protein